MWLSPKVAAALRAGAVFVRRGSGRLLPPAPPIAKTEHAATGSDHPGNTSTHDRAGNRTRCALLSRRRIVDKPHDESLAIGNVENVHVSETSRPKNELIRSLGSKLERGFPKNWSQCLYIKRSNSANIETLFQSPLLDHRLTACTCYGG
jgi:hypothetical protein